MTNSKKTQHTFPIECWGRTKSGEKALGEAVEVDVIVSSSGRNTLTSNVVCPYNTGSRGDRCSASYPGGKEKMGDGIGCPYFLDIPYALERGRRKSR